VFLCPIRCPLQNQLVGAHHPSACGPTWKFGPCFQAVCRDAGGSRLGRDPRSPARVISVSCRTGGAGRLVAAGWHGCRPGDGSPKRRILASSRGFVQSAQVAVPPDDSEPIALRRRLSGLPRGARRAAPRPPHRAGSGRARASESRTLHLQRRVPAVTAGRQSGRNDAERRRRPAPVAVRCGERPAGRAPGPARWPVRVLRLPRPADPRLSPIPRPSSI
jgi:hypothetical protein